MVSIMQCNDFRREAENWMEGARGTASASHLEHCPRCRALIQDLEAIRNVAGGLSETAPAPAPRVWTALRAQLEAEGIIREQTGWGRWLEFLPALPRPVLAGAYVAVLLVGAVLVSLQTSPRFEPLARLAPAAPEIASIAATQTRLADVESRTVALVRKQSPQVSVTYRKNLAIIDRFIAECEKAVREEPANELALEYLHGAYQQKAELLSNMVARGVRGE